MKDKYLQYILAGILLILLGLISDPFMLWMPSMALMVILVLVAALVLSWMGFLMQEGEGDEREVLHKMKAGRLAYLSGLAVLVVALVYQGFTHQIDHFIVVALGVMVLSKVLARGYLERHS